MTTAQLTTNIHVYDDLKAEALNEAILEAEEAIEELEALDDATLTELLEKAQQYVASHDTIDAPEFVEEIGCYDDGSLYVANIVLDRTLEVVTDDVIETRGESLTKEDELKLQELDKRLNALLSD